MEFLKYASISHPPQTEKITRYLHGPRGIHAQHDGTTWTYHAQDGLGSVRAMVDVAGGLSGIVNYTPYGVPDAPVDGFGFTGEYTDLNDQIYLRARYYNTADGVFTAQDFLETPNRYSYADNNPTNIVDPSGLQGTPISPRIPDTPTIDNPPDWWWDPPGKIPPNSCS